MRHSICSAKSAWWRLSDLPRQRENRLAGDRYVYKSSRAHSRQYNLVKLTVARVALRPHRMPGVLLQSSHSVAGDPACGLKYPRVQMSQEPLPIAPSTLLVPCAHGSHGSVFDSWDDPALQPHLPPLSSTRSRGQMARPLSTEMTTCPSLRDKPNSPCVGTESTASYDPAPTYSMGADPLAPKAASSRVAKLLASVKLGSWWSTGSESVSHAVKATRFRSPTVVSLGAAVPDCSQRIPLARRPHTAV
eukprot:7389356-Prymnesium_polylepis.1